MADRDTRFDDEDKNKGAIAPVFKDRNEMCGFFFAGVCRGASPQLIAEATGINPRTATKLLNRNIRKYVGVKQEFERLGEQEFGDVYYTDEIAARLEAAHKRIKTRASKASSNGAAKDLKPAAPRRGRPAAA